MWKNFFSHVNARRQNVNILNGNAPDYEAECASYEAKIKAYGGIDLFLAGIGEDGHIACVTRLQSPRQPCYPHPVLPSPFVSLDHANKTSGSTSPVPRSCRARASRR